MAASIDERIVSMAFDNAKFEANVAKTLATLDKLNASLGKVGQVNGLADIEAAADKVTLAGPMSALDKLKAKLGLAGSGAAQGFGDIEAASSKVSLLNPMSALDRLRVKLGMVGSGADKSFAEIEAAAGKVTLSDMSSAVDSTTAKFGALEVAAVAAFGTIVAKATAASTEILKGFTIGPLSDGMEEYGLKLNSIQTIMAATGKGTKPVTDALTDLNHYSDRTIYSFRDMIENIPKFTNAGVKLKPAVKAIQGIAQVAAVSGASTNEAARAMFNFGQAMGSGSVRAVDWRSIDLANMGTIEFKQQLIDTAVAMGTLTKTGDNTYKTLKGTEVSSKNFTAGLQDQWLTTEALTKTLGKYSDEQTEIGKKAFKAATNIKTLSQLLDVWKESIASGWGQTFEHIFGNFDQSLALWKNVDKAVGGILARSAETRNKILGDWEKLGGRTALIKGISNVWEALGDVLGTIRDAFRDIFPRKTGKDLVEMTQRFRDFTENLKPSEEMLENLKRTFKGVFAIMSIGWTITKGILGIIGDLIGVVTGGSGGFLSFTASIGDFFVALDGAISKGKALQGVFDAVSAAIKAPLTVLKDLIEALGNAFGFGDEQTGEGISAASERIVAKLEKMGEVLGLTEENWQKFKDALEDVKRFLAPLGDFIGEVFDEIKEKVDQGLEALTSDKGLEILRTGFIGGIFVYLKKLVSGLDINIGVKGVESLNDAMKALTGSLTAIQNNIKAKTLMNIAIAIGLLAASVMILSTVDSDKLGQALTGIAVGLGQLVAAMALLAKIGGPSAFITLPIMAAGLMILAGSAVVLAGALHILARLDWDEIVRALVALGGALAVLAVGTRLIGPQVALVAPALVALSFALNLLAASMTVIGALKWEEIIKGLFGIGGALVAIGIGSKMIGPGITLIGPSLVALGAGLILISGAIGTLGRMSLGGLAKGLLGISLALIGIGIGIATIPPTLAAQAAGLILVAVALNGIAVAVGIMGSFGFDTIIKGLIGLGGALAILAVGLNLMTGAGMGSLALMGAAAALAVLVPTLILLGLIPWAVIFKGLAGIALILGTLAVVGLVVSGPLAAIGAALTTLGLAMMAIAASIFIFAQALRVLSIVGTKGLIVLGAAITGFIVLIPKLIKDFLLGLVTVLEELVKLLPKIVEAAANMVIALINGIVKAAPRLGEAVQALIAAFFKIIMESLPDLIEAGWQMLIAFLKGFDDNIEEVQARATSIILKFIGGLTDAIPDLLAAGSKFLLTFLRGINSKIERIVTLAGESVVKFLNGIANKIPDIQAAGTRVILNFLNGITQHIGRVSAAGTRAILRFMEGLGSMTRQVVEKGLEIAGKFIRAVARGLVRLADVGAQALIDFINGLARVIRRRDDELRAAGWNLADAIIDGMIEGFAELGDKVVGAADKIIGKLPWAAKKLLGIKSPSKVFEQIGFYTMVGLNKGIIDGGAGSEKVMTTAGSRVVRAAQDAMAKLPDALPDVMNLDPVVSPVLDLSAVEKEASRMGDMMTPVPVVPTASLGQANAIADETAAADQAQAEAAANAAPVLHFEQNNHSPEALPDVEIYRRTSNMLAKASREVSLV